MTNTYSVTMYGHEDYPMLRAWWMARTCSAPPETMFPTESTFILKTNGLPHYAISLYLTNTSEFCLAENFCRNPELQADPGAVGHLLKYIENFARRRNYRNILCMTAQPKLAGSYEAIGFQADTSPFTVLAKSLSE